MLERGGKRKKGQNLPGVDADRHKLYTKQYIRRHVYMFKAIIPQLHWSFFSPHRGKEIETYFQGKKEERNKLSFRNNN